MLRGAVHVTCRSVCYIANARGHPPRQCQWMFFVGTTGTHSFGVTMGRMGLGCEVKAGGLAVSGFWPSSAKAPKGGPILNGYFATPLYVNPIITILSNNAANPFEVSDVHCDRDRRGPRSLDGGARNSGVWIRI